MNNNFQKKNLNEKTEPEQFMAEDDFEDNFFDDEPMRKPKGKKIKKMRQFYDR